jgi:hypothetical protein
MKSNGLKTADYSSLAGRVPGAQPRTCVLRRSARSRADLFRGEAEDGRRGDAEDAEVVVDLAAVMDFVLDHGAQAEADGRFGAGDGHAAALEVVVSEAAENFHRFSVRLFHEREDVVEAVGELFAVRGVAAGFALDVFGPEVAFDDGEVARQVAESEFSRGAGPVELAGRDAARDAHGAVANAVEIFQERLDGADFHRAIVQQARGEAEERNSKAKEQGEEADPSPIPQALRAGDPGGPFFVLKKRDRVRDDTRSLRDRALMPAGARELVALDASAFGDC